ncbi:MAG: shikimate dehydrogenase [Candidatus Euphemobacter frigidus]|nr:shikimate dehydrogenase [Candidatus Euphemobacter frigidus]MDP8275766.1 shikimate dehydrogenase [Candidatus Euphemobacter frigidus]
MGQPRDSSTTLTGLFGWPVLHSISPLIHNAAFTSAGLNWIYRAFGVEPENLESAFMDFRMRRGKGLNITIPHKQAVMDLLDELSEEARLIGAVNTVLFQERRALGYNTDGAGFIRALKEEKRFSPKGKHVCLIGAGGAGRAVAVTATREGADRVSISDLAPDRARELSEWVNRKFGPGRAGVFQVGSPEGDEIIAGADLVVDATPLGLNPDDPLSFDPSLLSASALVMDLVYNPPETPLLKAVRARGVGGINGLGMLVHQAAAAWEIWTGREPPLQVMKEAAQQALYGKN